MYNFTKVMVMNRLKELREAAGWKQSDLADRLGVQQQAISKYERQNVDLDTDTIRRLCGIFGCTADYLLGLSPVRSPGIAPEEYEILAAWRQADARARGMVELALEPWMIKEKDAAG